MSANAGRASRGCGLWVQCACTLLVAAGAAYASYRHGQAFALRFGADATTAAIWPLIVDGLLTTATVELWKPGRAGKWRAWLAFLFGVALSMCANIASAPELSAFAIAVAACPPLALLLAVELLNRALKRHGAETIATETKTDRHETAEPEAKTEPEAAGTGNETGRVVPLVALSAGLGRRAMTAERRMWDYYQAQLAQGRTPTGAELDRMAKTNNYGRRVLRRWRTEGRLHNDQRSPPRVTHLGRGARPACADDHGGPAAGS
ncbi:DUF2637 domain-containing protein [Pseudonocardia eucalypti]|uniref:DUF2637 domain-containing protein n=1 Tax=Pseudonocardia eucalypti TaxID=648755 RepID=A0ABP9Q1V0_9PSEU|nr:hypothetical protein [Pseudonocardia eucalypti]